MITLQHFLTLILGGDVGKVKETMPAIGKLSQSRLVKYQEKSFWKVIEIYYEISR